ncbi:hypothetical protein NitYY0826_C1026 [Nitratiruptor sp. YY08-26]|uniref:hypothetical protein n=1 Tax=unclassified Nitratiruptor TaxID=2624044 RepID=UPI001915C403|nr:MULTISPECIES: hypothetical protein [unclassified Nitratiruptor]BCD62155.1 hypothetical protein NitYY0813_C1024 [Nitratiruptor sp. YY08-13]BCD66091.1 hypothetical protein NitYY0826_C1026 [Nitratiruptor sp. YY08-26]
MESENNIPKEDILIVEAEIVPNGLGGWMIRCVNTETGEERYCKTIEEYSAFLNECVYTTSKENFQAVWLESPQATPQMIADVRAKLMAYYNQIEQT